MVYVCVIFFVLLNLLVAVVNETYILGKLEQKQMENDLQEEYIHETNQKGINVFHRSKQPVLQAALIQKLKRFVKFISNQSIHHNDDTSFRTDTQDDDISLDEKQIIVLEKLQKMLLSDGFNKTIIDKFIQRLSLKNINDDDDNTFLFEMKESRTIKILYDEFKIFNNQYEKLAQDWQKAATTASEMILVNTVDREQILIMEQHIKILDQRSRKFHNLISKALKNIVEIYNRFTTDQINKSNNYIIVEAAGELAGIEDDCGTVTVDVDESD